MDKLINTLNKQIHDVYFNIEYNQEISVSISPVIKSRKSKSSPWYYITLSIDEESPADRILNRCELPRFLNQISGKTLYIDSESKISRDLVRKSGYKITYSKENADYVVISKPKVYAYIHRNILVVDTEGDAVYRCEIVKNSLTRYSPPVNIYISALAKKIGVNVGSLEYFSKNDTASEDFVIWKLNDNQNHLEILRGDGTYDYILDCDLPLTASNKLSVDTLDLFCRLAKTDYNMFEKAVMASNAKDYPLTFRMFMNHDEPAKFSRTRNIIWLMDIIGFKCDDPNYSFSVEDVNLLQQWILYKLGVSADGGFVDMEKYTNIPYAYKTLLRSRIAVAPVKVTEPISLRELKLKAKQ